MKPSSLPSPSSVSSSPGPWVRTFLMGLACALGVLGAQRLLGREGTATQLPIIPVTVGKTTVRAEVAADDLSRTRGLMYREKLGEDQGMLFVYPSSRPMSFWMRNTLIPLDIAYVDSGKKIARITSMRPLTDDSHPSGGPVLYALEVNQGWFSAHSVKEGDELEFTLPPGMVATE